MSYADGERWLRAALDAGWTRVGEDDGYAQLSSPAGTLRAVVRRGNADDPEPVSTSSVRVVDRRTGELVSAVWAVLGLGAEAGGWS